MSTKQRRIIVTSALIYANGPVHIGHLVEYTQTDIFARAMRLIGHECYYICGNDAHGTPIMINAEKVGITPEDLIAQMASEHIHDFDDFLINFDQFYTTHSPENRQHSEAIYQALKDNDDLFTKEITQAFDEQKQLFLPDRYVKGTCPRCKTPDQYGDNCEVCGASYDTTDLIDPRSALSGTTPIEKQTEHVFFNLPKYEAWLQDWLSSNPLQDSVKNKLKEWFDGGLKAWDICRDAPYFGFEIPDMPNKYFYVWLDAPIGYIASFEKFCETHPNLSVDAFWNADSQTELIHVIGKDIVYFHALFWPAMLKGAKRRVPSHIQVHGFLTVDGAKMSKSRGTFIKARTYLNHLNPEYLRYYFATKLDDGVEDMDLNFDDFISRVNSDLVGKIVNIASRSSGFIHKMGGGTLAAQLPNPELYQQFVDARDEIASDYENFAFAKLTRQVSALADLANQYIDAQKPWEMKKQPGNEAAIVEVCTQCLNLFRVLMTYLKPILPNMAQDAEQFLKVELTWDGLANPLLDHSIEKFKPLMTRVEREHIDAMLAESREAQATANA